MTGAKSGAFAGGGRLLERGTVDQARLTWRLLRDPRVSSLRYAIPALVLAYLVSPVDAIPDLLLGIGQTDDLGVAVLAFMLMVRIVPKLAPTRVVNDHLRDMGLGGRTRQQERAGADEAIEARFDVRR